MKMKWMMSALLLTLPLLGLGQQITSSAGGIYASPTGSMSMVVGQFNYQNQGQSTTLTGGVLQVYLQRALARELDATKIVLWPNPVKDDLYLRMDGEPAADLRYQVYDLAGRILMDRGFEPDELRIPMRQHPAGTYLILLTLPNQIPVPFKVIKL